MGDVPHFNHSKNDVQQTNESITIKAQKQLLKREQEARIEAEQERQRLYELLMQAPAIICILQGKDHVIEFANSEFRQFFGQRELVGKPIGVALPEIEPQGFIALLDQVYDSGEPYTGKEVRVLLDRQGDGILQEGYFNFVFQPTRTPTDPVDDIMVHVIEVTELIQARKEVLAGQERLTLAQRVGRIGTFDWSIPQNHIIWTPELELLYGLQPGGFEGHYENWAKRLHPDDIQRTAENIATAIAGGPPYNAEFRVIWPDGTIHWLLGKGEISAYDAEGKPLKMIGVNIDITERKQAEQDLQELNAHLESLVTQRTETLNQLNIELRRSNQELQDFAYVASHDLQEPLRKIQAFGNLLEEEYGETLGGGRSYIQRMRNAASRMRVLIDDLLTFSRVTTRALPFSPVDLATIMRDVLDDLEPRLKSTHGTIEVGELPTVEADPRQMYQMFQNLLSNALKFHRPGIPPIVKVTVSNQTNTETGEAYYLIQIEDNGIGFEEKYLDRIFTVFQRLHGKDEYEGTGIGLAVVRKIVERHGGTVTARSSVGQGATFLVTLPVTHHAEKEAPIHEI